MAARSQSRGYPIVFDNGSWVYEDTGMMDDNSRPCKKCGKIPGNGGLDPCLMPLIAALNAAGLKTGASCCGHGYRPANIALEDDREIFIARSWEEARKIDSVIEVDISGRRIK